MYNGDPREREHLHSLALMNELDQAQHTSLEEDARAHLLEAVRHMQAIYEHLEESTELIEESGARRDVEKARKHVGIAINLAQGAVSMPGAKMMAALRECRDHIETANRQMSRAGMEAAI